MIRSFVAGLPRDEWNIGIIYQELGDIVRRGITESVHWLPADPWRILADPFCITGPDGQIVCLAEKLNHWVGRGEIWAARIDGSSAVDGIVFTPHISAPVHLSYPFVVTESGINYAVMESYEAGGLFLWRQEGQGWHYHAKILDEPVLDPTLYHDGFRWWLFCTFFGDGSDEKLQLFHSNTLAGQWEPHRQNPVKCDRGSARPGGALVRVDGELYRFSQNSRQTYGGSLMINKVVTLTPNVYEEHPVRELRPPSDAYPDGLHTIAAAGCVTIIDGKRWHRSLWADPARRVLSKLHKVRRRQRRRSFPTTVTIRAIP
jgi:hypothetical protein